MEGVHTPSGSIFIEIHNTHKWRSESVRQHHKEILEARRKDGAHHDQLTRTDRKRVSAINKSKKTLKKLKTKISAAKAITAKAKQDESDQELSSEDDADADQAGNAFGGRESVVKKKKKKKGKKG